MVGINGGTMKRNMEEKIMDARKMQDGKDDEKTRGGIRMSVKEWSRIIGQDRWRKMRRRRR